MTSRTFRAAHRSTSTATTSGTTTPRAICSAPSRCAAHCSSSCAARHRTQSSPATRQAEPPLALETSSADLEVLLCLQRANLSHSHALARLLAGTGGDEAAKAGEWFHNVIFDDQHGLALDAYVPPGPVSTATAAVCHHADRVTQSVAAIRARTLASCWCTAAASCAARRSPTSTRFSRP